MFAIGKTDARLMNSYQDPPNPQCLVCSAAYSDVRVDLASATLQHLVEGVLALGYRSFSIFSPDGLIYERDDAEEDDMEEELANKLSNMGIVPGTIIRISDDGEHRVDLALTVEDAKGPLKIQPVKIPNQPTPKSGTGALENEKEVNGTHTNGAVANGISRNKRPASEDLQDRPATKQKIDKDDVIVIDDADGAIVLD